MTVKMTRYVTTAAISCDGKQKYSYQGDYYDAEEGQVLFCSRCGSPSNIL
jgi:hypothetical protein